MRDGEGRKRGEERGGRGRRGRRGGTAIGELAAPSCQLCNHA